MKNSVKKSIDQLLSSNSLVLSTDSMNKITGGNDGDKQDSDYGIGMQDIIDG